MREDFYALTNKCNVLAINVKSWMIKELVLSGLGIQNFGLSTNHEIFKTIAKTGTRSSKCIPQGQRSVTSSSDRRCSVTLYWENIWKKIVRNGWLLKFGLDLSFLCVLQAMRNYKTGQVMPLCVHIYVFFSPDDSTSEIRKNGIWNFRILILGLKQSHGPEISFLLR